MNSFELLDALKKAGYLKQNSSEFWWSNFGTFEVVIGAVLTQRTKWQNVELSLKNLRQNYLVSLENLAKSDHFLVSTLIRSSGFADQKAARIVKLAKNIKDHFGAFEIFQQEADKEWLLSQSGLGNESADAILCYACKKPVMVLDSYTGRLLRYFGYEFESYEDMQEWFYSGIYSSWDKVTGLYGGEIDETKLWARFHGKIVEFCKENMTSKGLDRNLLKL